MRLVVIFVFIFQALQMGLVNAHVTAEAAHVVAHDHASEDHTDFRLSLFDGGDHTHAHADGSGSFSHDNHTHHITVVGLGSDHALLLSSNKAGPSFSFIAANLSQGSLSRIERPKWATTTPVVVNL